MGVENGMAREARRVFSANFKKYLEKAQKTQLDVANELNVTTSTVSDWANEKKYPRVDNMQAIADYLGVLLSDLRDEKPAVSQVDELFSAIRENPRLILIYQRLVELPEEELARVEKVIDAVIGK